MTNEFLFLGPGDQNPFDRLKYYIDKKEAVTRGMISVFRSGAAVPTTSDIPSGKYAVWYNTTSQAIAIYYNLNGTIAQYSSGGGGSISLTTTGTSGPATLIGGILNIPQYSGGGGAVSSVFGRTGTVVAASNDYTFAQIGSKPTSLAGYGISDPVVLTTGSYANPAWITAIPWSIISSTPTNVAGYGITDAVTLTGTQTLTNKTIAGTQITGNISGNAASITGSITESQVTNLTSDLAAKQATITVTTAGTSGPATLSSGTLNIPQYAGGSTLLTRQSITSGTTATGTSGNLIVTFNFASTASTFNFTMPASPTDQQVVAFEAGGTLTTGTEVTTLTITPNSGQSIIQSTALTTLGVGEYALYKWNNSLTAWFREL